MEIKSILKIKIKFWAWLIGTLLAILAIIVSVTVPEIRQTVGLDETVKVQSSLVTQRGTLKLFAFGVSDVFYPQAFSSPPNLQFGSGIESLGRFKLVEQRRDGFKYEVEYAFTPGMEVS